MDAEVVDGTDEILIITSVIIVFYPILVVRCCLFRYPRHPQSKLIAVAVKFDENYITVSLASRSTVIWDIVQNGSNGGRVARSAFT